MGYKTGAGLGKNEQGILKPVILATQWGRYGLGSTVKAEAYEDLHVNKPFSCKFNSIYY